MTRQTAEAYTDLFKYLETFGVIFNEVMMDFEGATRKALLCVSPLCEISGCIFHFGQVSMRLFKTLMNNLSKIPFSLLTLT